MFDDALIAGVIMLKKAILYLYKVKAPAGRLLPESKISKLHEQKAMQRHSIEYAGRASLSPTWV
ncbi:MAG: hypothetical protein ACOC2C_07815 [Cyclonatronaceae bacterium]